MYKILRHWDRWTKPLPFRGLNVSCGSHWPHAQQGSAASQTFTADGHGQQSHHEVALQVHPDSVGKSDEEDSTCHFQFLREVCSILSDKDERAAYNEQGTVDKDSAVLNQTWD